MAVAHVQAANGAGNGALQTIAATFGSSTVNGNAILVAVIWDPSGGATLTSVTDTAGNSYTKIGSQFTSPNSNSVQHAFALNITGGASQVITATFSNASASFRRIIAHEVSGLALSAAFDKDSGGSWAAGSPLSDTSVTTTENGEYIFASAMNGDGNGSEVFSPGSGFTEPANSTASAANNEVMAEYQIQTSAGSIAAGFTRSGTGGVESVMRTSTFKAAAAASPFAQLSWPLPQPPKYPTAIRTSIGTTTGIISTIIPPFKQCDWILPKIAKRLNPSFTVRAQTVNNPQPFQQEDWPVPFTPRFPIGLRTSLSTTIGLNETIPLPFNQEDWPTSRKIPPLNTSFTIEAQLADAVFPFNQEDWPTPRRRLSLNTSFIYTQQNISTPFNQSDWPNVRPAQGAVNARTWIGQTLALLTASQPGPFNTFAWPVPTQPRYPVLARTTIGGTIGLRNQVVTVPFNQFDWPIPKPKAFPGSARTSTSFMVPTETPPVVSGLPRNIPFIATMGAMTAR